MGTGGGGRISRRHCTRRARVGGPAAAFGLGQALVARAEDDARAEGVQQLVLLTETAQLFFSRLGYRLIERSAAPEQLRQSAEFRSLCPVSAVCMAKNLGRG